MTIFRVMLLNQGLQLVFYGKVFEQASEKFCLDKILFKNPVVINI